MISSANLSGARFMTLAMLGFAISDTAIKTLNQQLPLFELFFIRGFFVIIAFVILLKRTDAVMPRARFEWRIMISRGVIECAVAYCFFTALQQVSLTDATTILQLLPLVITIAAFLVFGEKFGLPRLLAIVAGFVGVCFVVKPSFTEVNPSYGYAFVAMILITGREMLTRLLPKETSSLWTAFTLACCIITMGTVGTIVGGNWVTPSLAQFGLIVLSASCVFGSYISSVMSMRIGEVSFVSGFRYTGILFVIVLDIIVFSDPPDALSLFGCFLIACAGIFTISRECLSQS